MAGPPNKAPFLTDLRRTLETELVTHTIERELGRGGMATVFLARDVRHDRPVALKVLHQDLAHALGAERFQREIRLAARLQHPHILTVFDSGETAGQLWFTMPYVEGESLRDRLDRDRQLPVDDALRIAREAAQALEYAHQHGVIHRDIKPENLLITRDGNTLVADFGIARSIAATEQKLTETGLAIGTPSYMSPEQASGEQDMTARTDIYSLGAVLFEMLAGEPPFTGPTAQAIIAKRFSGEVPSVRRSRPAVPVAVEQAILRALAVVPADRFASAAEFGRALDPAGTAAPPAVPTVATAAGAPARGAASKRWLSPALMTLATGFLLGVGVLFAWRSRHAGDLPADGAKLVAVLPFENLGSADDEYFADGITDEVRGKLSALSGLRVIAGGSSKEYKRSTKSLPDIAAELGVDYLLVAKVRWAKGSDGTPRVRVSPELVHITGTTPTVQWQQPFEASLTDVFRVQADIAGQVAGALDLALGADQQEQLAERPTRSLAAYDAYLRGQAIIGGDPASLRRRIERFEEAVRLDSGFVDAWAQLSAAVGTLYSNSVPDPAVAARAKFAAERALALDPAGATGESAVARYHLAVRRDAAEAERHMARALAAAPHDATLLAATARVERGLGRMDAALAHLQQARALDPRSIGVTISLQTVLLWLRRYPEALAASEAALTLAPGDLSITQDKAMVYAAQGNLAAAREVVRQVSPSVPQAEIAAFFANYWDMYWVLDDAQQQLLLTLDSSAFDNDRSAWGTALMQVYELRGDRARARAYADSAYVVSARQINDAPGDPQRRVLSGLQLAYAGRKAEAIAAGLQGVRLAPLERDRINGAYYQQLMARIYLMTGEPEKALDMLEPLLRIPYFLSPGWLRIDPTWAPLRGNPRFEKLIAT